MHSFGEEVFMWFFRMSLWPLWTYVSDWMGETIFQVRTSAAGFASLIDFREIPMLPLVVILIIFIKRESMRAPWLMA